ncbi:hypothetical protein E2P81_ATG01924 [Venturia nashicola]|nr:hypothetical protein E2P81_ATG01924 [Venturia nashicola]
MPAYCRLCAGGLGPKGSFASLYINFLRKGSFPGRMLRASPTAREPAVRRRLPGLEGVVRSQTEEVWVEPWVDIAGNSFQPDEQQTNHLGHCPYFGATCLLLLADSSCDWLEAAIEAWHRSVMSRIFLTNACARRSAGSGTVLAERHREGGMECEER